MAELKPCPFCRGEAYMAQNYLGQKYVRCPDCGAVVWGRDDEDWSDKQGEKQAADAWNRRVYANNLTEAIERNTAKIVKKSNELLAEYIRHLQEKNNALDEELASLLNEADADMRGGDAE